MERKDDGGGEAGMVTDAKESGPRPKDRIGVRLV